MTKKEKKVYNYFQKLIKDEYSQKQFNILNVYFIEKNVNNLTQSFYAVEYLCHKKLFYEIIMFNKVVVDLKSVVLTVEGLQKLQTIKTETVKTLYG